MSSEKPGGLGIEVLDIKNKVLLVKWLYKLLNEEGILHELLWNKYLRGKSLSQVQQSQQTHLFGEV